MQDMPGIVALTTALQLGGCSGFKFTVHLQVVAGAGASWVWPFLVQATGNLNYGQQGAIALQVSPVSAPKVFQATFGLTYGATLALESSCDKATLVNVSEGKAFSASVDGSPPLAGETLSVPSSTCVRIGLADLIKAVTKIGLLGNEALGGDICVSFVVQGSTMQASLMTSTGEFLGLEPGTDSVFVTPNASNEALTISGVSYEPSARATTDLYLVVLNNHVGSPVTSPPSQSLDLPSSMPLTTIVLPVAGPSGPPPPPSNVYLDNYEYGSPSALLRWSHTGSASGFNIYQGGSFMGLDCQGWNLISTASANARSQSVPMFTGYDFQYCYKVSAFNAAGESTAVEGY
jgi:hypothetical protein